MKWNDECSQSSAEDFFEKQISNKEISGTEWTPMSDAFWDTVMMNELIAQEYEMELGEQSGWDYLSTRFFCIAF